MARGGRGGADDTLPLGEEGQKEQQRGQTSPSSPGKKPKKSKKSKKKKKDKEAKAVAQGALQHCPCCNRSQAMGLKDLHAASFKCLGPDHPMQDCEYCRDLPHSTKRFLRQAEWLRTSKYLSREQLRNKGRAAAQGGPC